MSFHTAHEAAVLLAVVAGSINVVFMQWHSPYLFYVVKHNSHTDYVACLLQLLTELV